MQSWGYDSKFGRRDTLNFPTFSGVLGLICCAMGRSGGQDEFLADFSDMDMSVVAYTKSKQNKDPFLRDFHTVGNGYDIRDKWQSLLIPKKSDGKRPVGSGSKLTYRYYLQNMAFAVALEVPSTHADNVADAVKSPVWDLYLGRKCCVPTEFIFQGKFENVEDAKAKAQELAKCKELTEGFRVLKGEYDDGEVLTLNDIPIRFGQNKLYRDRRVTKIDTEME